MPSSSYMGRPFVFYCIFLRTRSLFRAAAGYVAFSCSRIFRCLWQAHFPVRHFLCPHLRRTSDHCLSRLIAIVSCHKSGFYFDVYLSKQRNIIIFILCKKIAFHRNFIKFLDFRSIRHLVVIIVHQIFIQILGSVQRPLNLLTIHLIAYHNRSFLALVTPSLCHCLAALHVRFNISMFYLLCPVNPALFQKHAEHP